MVFDGGVIATVFGQVAVEKLGSALSKTQEHNKLLTRIPEAGLNESYLGDQQSKYDLQKNSNADQAPVDSFAIT
jgi:hypothetical protein